jgi:hypothetical protein
MVERNTQCPRTGECCSASALILVTCKSKATTSWGRHERRCGSKALPGRDASVSRHRLRSSSQESRRSGWAIWVSISSKTSPGALPWRRRTPWRPDVCPSRACRESHLPFACILPWKPSLTDYRAPGRAWLRRLLRHLSGSFRSYS